MEFNAVNTGMYLMGMALVIIFARVFAKPLKIILKLSINTLIGGAALFLVNAVGNTASFYIGINAFTAITCGILGIPGFILVVIAKFLFYTA